MPDWMSRERKDPTASGSSSATTSTATPAAPPPLLLSPEPAGRCHPERSEGPAFSNAQGSFQRRVAPVVTPVRTLQGCPVPSLAWAGVLTCSTLRHACHPERSEGSLLPDWGWPLWKLETQFEGNRRGGRHARLRKSAIRDLQSQFQRIRADPRQSVARKVRRKGQPPGRPLETGNLKFETVAPNSLSSSPTTPPPGQSPPATGTPARSSLSRCGR